jgi:hypothetical protein
LSRRAAFARWSLASALAVAALAVTATSAAAAPPINPVGTVNLRDLAAHARHAPYRPALRNSPAQVKWRAREAGREQPAPLAATGGLKPPKVRGLPIVSDESRRGFEALGIADTVFTNGFEPEPPDQGLCGGRFQGATYLFESVNLALSLYDTDSNQYTPAVDLNSFYGLPPAFDPTTERYGPFLSDPKCYFDPDTGHWYHTILEIAVDPVTGDFGNRSATLIAASVGCDPFGPYNVYSIDATTPAARNARASETSRCSAPTRTGSSSRPLSTASRAPRSTARRSTRWTSARSPRAAR